MVDPMTTVTRALPHLAFLMVLPMTLTPLPAAAAATPKATTDIIALPLNPMLPPGQRLCAAKTATGLGYTMLRPAAGPMPNETDFVLVNYIGYLAATGAVFDQNTGSAFPVGGVIPGFSKGLQMMAKTGVARFCIPAAMGYGAEGSGPIPPNSDLVFQVELIDYKTAAEVEAMRKASEGEAPSPGAGAVTGQ